VVLVRCPCRQVRAKREVDRRDGRLSVRSRGRPSRRRSNAATWTAAGIWRATRSAPLSTATLATTFSASWPLLRARAAAFPCTAARVPVAGPTGAASAPPPRGPGTAPDASAGAARDTVPAGDRSFGGEAATVSVSGRTLRNKAHSLDALLD